MENKHEFVRLNHLISYDPRTVTDILQLYPQPNIIPPQTPNNKRKQLILQSPFNKKHHTRTLSEPSSPNIITHQRTRCQSEPIQNIHQNHQHAIISSVKSPSKLTRILNTTSAKQPTSNRDEPLLLSSNLTQSHDPACKPPAKFTTLRKRLQAMQASSATMRFRSTSIPATSTTTTTNAPETSSSPIKEVSGLPPIPSSRPRARRASRPPQAITPLPQPAHRTTPRVESDQVKLAKLTKHQTNHNKKRFCVIKVEVVHMDRLRPPSPEGNFRKGASTKKNQFSRAGKGKQEEEEEHIEEIHVRLPAPSHFIHLQQTQKKRVRWNYPQLAVDLQEFYHQRVLRQHQPQEEEEPEENSTPSRPSPSFSTSSSSLTPLSSSASSNPQSPPPKEPSTEPAFPAVKPILKINFRLSRQPPSAPDAQPGPGDGPGQKEENVSEPTASEDVPQRAVAYLLDSNGNLVLPPPVLGPHADAPPDPLASLEPPFVKVSRRIWRDQ
ncbi:hypothetical protein VP01_1836g9 [Puccinia sorghi]|uniref:Uncharacterized protein n=1 Tax=Puccinia sorghi TaxID=27349 RepID=A0A0L6VDT9_9BASI|nr:hypothetical protein VP01_1836g9 [Puccinia sorghi]